jgi:hypothetical protein
MTSDLDPIADKATGYRMRAFVDGCGTVVGVMELLNRAAGRFSQADAAVIAPFAALAGAALQCGGGADGDAEMEE